MDNINELGSHELRSLDVMNNSRLMMISTILGHEPIALNAINAMNNSWLWLA